MTLLDYLRRVREEVANDFMNYDCPHLERVLEKYNLMHADDPQEILNALDSEIEALGSEEGGDADAMA